MLKGSEEIELKIKAFILGEELIDNIIEAIINIIDA